jgi:hypothetical protein
VDARARAHVPVCTRVSEGRASAPRLSRKHRPRRRAQRLCSQGSFVEPSVRVAPSRRAVGEKARSVPEAQRSFGPTQFRSRVTRNSSRSTGGLRGTAGCSVVASATRTRSMSIRPRRKASGFLASRSYRDKTRFGKWPMFDVTIVWAPARMAAARTWRSPGSGSFRAGTSGALLSTLGTWTNANATTAGNYSQKSFSLAAWRGQTVRVPVPRDHGHQPADELPNRRRFSEVRAIPRAGGPAPPALPLGGE